MTISILGCGWLGLPLAESLNDDGYKIKGSTTTLEKIQLLKDKNIEPFHLKLNPCLKCEDCADFWQSDTLIMNVPPGRSRDNVESFHPAQVQAVIDELENSAVSHFIFVSSTSVYPARPGKVEENDTQAGQAVRSSGNALIEAERMLISQSEFATTVVRFGGLYGYDRHPGRYMAGRKNLGKGNAPINFIHRDDCVNIIKQIIEDEVKGEIFNAVADAHPPKKLFYPAMAKSLGLKPPTFEEDKAEDYKLVSNQKLKTMLGYEFKYPNPMDM